ncbi:hypothetical protein EZV62_023770 [Acer yangbiense]|uniref:Uncharacterized protein n=1 Tax=Acer yangbiense TaxID=1000413 RepID=A0A5C7H4T2_9ROSI|nr:hypothetical protein EZV62_023770 [Acer yangbiense]
MATDKVKDQYVQPAIPRFDGHYDHWSMLMENFLRSKEYWNLIEIGFAEPAEDVVLTETQRKTLKDQRLKDLKAKNYLFQAIDRTILETILEKNTSKQIWDSMKKKYQGTTRVKRAQLQALRKDFETLHMKPGESVDDYFSRTMTIASKMKLHGEKMADVTVVEKILRSMTTKFNYVVCSIEESNDIDILSIDELHKCYTKFPRDKERGEKTNFAEKQEEETLLMAYHVKEEEPQLKLWYLDTGCSNHMCGSKSSFSHLKEAFHTTVTFGDNSTEKSEAFKAFKSFKAQVENEVGSTIKTFRTDRGGEFCSKEFEAFCVEQGKVPKSFWPEAVNWSIHVLNRSPTFSVQNMTPEEAWSGWKPAIDHFKIFGSVAYAHIPDEKRKKLDNKGEKCVFLGVSEHSKAYKLFNPSTNKIVTSRDVIFDEENTWNWTENGSTQQQQHIPVNFDEDGDDKKDGQSYQQYDQQPLQQEQQHLQPSISRENQLAEATEASSSRSQCSKRRPAWMMDYEVRGVVQPDDNDDTIAHFGDGKKILIVCLYVDDLIYTGSDKDMFDVFKKSMMTEFDMSDLGLMHYYLGIEVNQSSAGIFISQKKYVQEVLNRFQMKNCNPVTTPTEMGLKLVKNPEGEKVDNTGYKQIVGSLMYLTATRPDLMYAVSLISRYMESPREIHLLAAKRILRYMQGTINYGLFYKKREKSRAVSWSSKKQQIVTLSTTEAEFVAATSCSCQAIWLRRLLEALHYRQQGPTLIYCDNVSAIKLSRNLVLHGRSKHIDVRYHFLRDLCKDGTIDLIFCRSEDQVADILTKPLKFPMFVKLRQMLGVCSLKDVT